MNDHGLIDLGFKGHPFTWNNKRGGLANIQERLDKGLANERWSLMFPEVNVTYLVALQSDHKLLLLQMEP